MQQQFLRPEKLQTHAHNFQNMSPTKCSRKAGMIENDLAQIIFFSFSNKCFP